MLAFAFMLLSTMTVILVEGECPQYGSDDSCTDNLPSLEFPLEGSLSQRVIEGSFGDSWPRTYCNNLPKKHVGIDLRANFQEPVYAAYDGTVVLIQPTSQWCTNWGSTIIIDHSGLFTTIYEHVEPDPNLDVGSQPIKGEIIGRIAEIAKIQDRTKASDCDTVNHLHFGIRCGGYSNICLRGALPNENGNSDYDPNTRKFTGCKCDPIFPGGFIDPQLAYENDKSTTPMSDGIYPLVQAFQVIPQSLTTGESFTIDYTVSDTGGSGLNRVELWRKDEQSDWLEIKRDALSSSDGPITGSFSDAPSNSGKYWYGIHVANNAGKWNDEKNSNSNNQPGGFRPVEVEVKEAEAAQASNSNSASANDWNEKGAKLAEDCKKYDEAIRCFEEALKIDQNLFMAWHNKGNALNKLGRTDEANNCWSEARRLNPDYYNGILGSFSTGLYIYDAGGMYLFVAPCIGCTCD